MSSARQNSRALMYVLRVDKKTLKLRSEIFIHWFKSTITTCSNEQALRVEVLHLLPVHSLCFVLKDEDRTSQLYPSSPRLLRSATLSYQDILSSPWNGKTK